MNKDDEWEIIDTGVPDRDLMETARFVAEEYEPLITLKAMISIIDTIFIPDAISPITIFTHHHTPDTAMLSNPASK